MMQPQHLTGIERDEVTALVQKLQQAGSRTPVSYGNVVSMTEAPQPTWADLQWAHEMRLPGEFFEYFVLDRAA